MFFAAGLFFLAWLMIYDRVFGAPLTITALPSEAGTLATVVLLIGVLLLHELCHGIGIQYYGHDARYGFKFLILYATSDTGYFWRNQMIVVAALPLVIISLLLVVVTVFVPAGLAQLLLLAAAINTAGAVGDLWMIWKALQYPVHALFEDDEDGMRIFMPTHPSQTEV
jgi:hypothetical protein